MIYRQVKHGRHIAAYEFLRREDDRFTTPEMRKRRSDLAKVLLLEHDNFREIDEVADYLLDYFEGIGLIVNQRLAPSYFVWCWSCYYILRYWHALLPYVKWARTQSGDKTYYREFEKMYRNVSRMDLREAGKKGTEFSHAEVRDFLREELQVTIRHFRPSDLGALMAIERPALKTGCYRVAQLEDVYEHHPDGFFVAQVLDEVAGYAIGFASDAKAQIECIAVDPLYWNLGIGKALAMHLIGRFRKLGAAKCTLKVRKSNARAVKLYEHIGFTVACAPVDCSEDTEDAHFMELDILCSTQSGVADARDAR